MRTIAFTLVAGLCLVSACGDDDDSSNDDGNNGSSAPFVEALSTALQDEESGSSLTATQADCLATAIVDSVGVTALEDAGVTPEQLADAEDIASLDVEVPSGAQEELTAAVGDCRATLVLKDQVINAFKEEAEVTLTAASNDCLSGELDDETVRSTFAAVALDASADSSELETQLKAAITACPSAMTEMLLGNPGLAAAYGGEVPEDAAECIGAYIESNATQVGEALTGDDPAAQQAVGTAIATACPAPAEAPAA
jgi:hypothetical protein